MGLPQQTTTPTEKPSTSETEIIARDSIPAPGSSSTTGSSANTNEVARGAMGGGGTGNAEEAADRLYEQRMEEEYAKREGGA